MKLSISKILSKEDVAELGKRKIESMSTLMSMYRKISKDKINLMFKNHTTFIDVIMTAISSDWKYFNSTKLKPEELRLSIEQAFLDKIRVALMAMNQIPLTDVLSKVLLMDTNFASVKFIEHICSLNPQSVVMKANSEGTTLHMVREKKQNLAGPSDASTSIKMENLLKYLFKHRPDIVKVLDKDFQWKNILHVHQFWLNLSKHENGSTTVNWLMIMAKANSVDTFSMYKRRMVLIFLLKITNYVTARRRSIRQIVDYLCLGKPGLVDLTFVHEVISSYPDKVEITEDTQSLAVYERIVKAASGADEPKSSNPMSLPGNLDSKVIPLLTQRITFWGIYNTSRHVLTEQKAKNVVCEHGCFFRYLIKLAKVRKPKIAEEYERQLHNMVKTFLHRILKANYPRPKPVAGIIEEIGGLHGLVDNKFITDAVSKFQMDFAFVDTGEVALREVVTHEMDPHRHLESDEIYDLLYGRPPFDRVLNVFTSLPEIAKSLLAENSMSFFEWLITLAKRDLQDDYFSIQSHLHNQVQKQVYEVHSQNHCQMTLHHVHKRICRGFPMLLSPNFLNWCLNQEESSFSVEQSWVYMKRYNNRGPRGQGANVNDKNEQKEFEETLSHIIRQIRIGTEISVVIGLLKNIPRNLASKALSKDPSWYDFLENNMKERNDRLKLASLIVEEAKKCVMDRIITISDLTNWISKGLPNFISPDVLALVLQQTQGFAMSDSKSGDAMIGIVRAMENGNISFFNEQDMVFVEKVLSYVPSNGSSDISTLTRTVQEETNNSMTSTMKLSEDYMKCYFLMFPMLFFVQDSSVILTCLALDWRKKHLEKPDSPHSSAEKVRKRRSGHPKGNHHKKKRKVKEHNREAKDRGNSENTTTCSKEGNLTPEKVVAGHSLVDGGKDGTAFIDEDSLKEDYEDVKTLIDSLPEQLIVDFAMNVLLQNDNAVEPRKMIEELVQVALIPSEVARVRQSPKGMKLFTEKAFDILKNHASVFVLVCDSDKDTCFENVKVIKVKIQEKSVRVETCNHQYNQNKEASSRCHNEIPAKQVTTCCDPRVLETPSSIKTREDESEENSAADNENNTNDDVIQCFDIPVHASTTKDVAIKEVSVKEKSTGLQAKQDVLPKKTSAPVRNADSACENSTPSHPEIPQFPVAHRSTTQDSERGERDEHFRQFCNHFLQINSGTCLTDLLLEDCYHHLKSERSARCRLAFEGYLFDFLLRNAKCYVLGGLQSQFGVSWITYSNWSSPAVNSAKSKNLSFLNLIPKVVEICYAFLKDCPKLEGALNDLCEATENNIRHHLNDYPEAEVFPVVRCLVLVALIRNLHCFYFSTQTPTIFLRKRVHCGRGERKHSNSANKEFKALFVNRTLAEAVIHMAEILRGRGPTSGKVLKRIWLARAPPKLCNVFGAGVSFTLSLRKYPSLFNSTSGEDFCTNEDTFKYLKSRLHHHH